MTDGGFSESVSLPRDAPLDAAQVLDRVPPVGRDDPRRDDTGGRQQDSKPPKHVDVQTETDQEPDQLELSEEARRLLKESGSGGSEVASESNAPANVKSSTFKAFA